MLTVRTLPYRGPASAGLGSSGSPSPGQQSNPKHMKQHYLGLTAIPALLLLSGCVDDNYDLANVDTTSEIKVNNLVVPVKLNAITLDDATDLDDNEYIETVTGKDGKQYYAFRKSETFKSNDIKIPAFTAAAPSIGYLNYNLSWLASASSVKPAASLNTITALTDMNFKCSLPSGITQIDYIGVRAATVGITMQLTSGTGNVTVQKLRLQFPAGLAVTDVNVYSGNGTQSLGKSAYNAATGVVEIPSLTIAKSGSTNVSLSFNGIDGSKIAVTGTPSTGTQMAYESRVGILSTGDVSYSGSSASNPPSLQIRFDVPNITATTLSASVYQKIERLDFEPVKVSGLPDFLAGNTTSLVTGDPQIYVGINNTIGDFHGETFLGFESVFTRGEGANAVTRINKGESPTKIQVSKEERTNIFLHGNPNSSPTLQQYLDPKPGNYEFPKLMDVLYATPGQNGEGWGLPKEIRVNARDLSIAGEHVRNMPLGQEIPGITGSYTVFVPLAFQAGTFIEYTTTEKGWNSDDLKDLNIYDLNLDATVSTSVPMGFKFRLQLLNSHGDVIATSSTLEIPGTANMMPVNLTVHADKEHPIKDLDGITYTADIVQDDIYADVPLSPNMAINLQDIRITVNGAYIHKF